MGQINLYELSVLPRNITVHKQEIIISAGIFFCLSESIFFIVFKYFLRIRGKTTTDSSIVAAFSACERFFSRRYDGTNYIYDSQTEQKVFQNRNYNPKIREELQWRCIQEILKRFVDH